VDYCASKHGAVGFHASMTDELRFLNIDACRPRSSAPTTSTRACSTASLPSALFSERHAVFSFQVAHFSSKTAFLGSFPEGEAQLFSCPNVLPILEPAYVIECIMEAVLTNREQYFMPRFLYITTWFHTLFNTKSIHLMTAYFKIAETMNDFKGRKPIAAKN
ncbi:hypothetical protein PRIPAC_81154, partial [Pristionchus pacificus]